MKQQASIGSIRALAIVTVVGLGTIGSVSHTKLVDAQRPPPQDFCDPSLPRNANDTYAYRNRGDRCEGLYIQGVAGTALRLVSLTELVEDFEPAFSKNAVIEWAVSPPSVVHLRAQGLRRRMYYRMDTDRQAAETSYRWPLDLVASLGLKASEVALLGWTSQRVAEQVREVYVPLRIGRGSSSTRSNIYNVAVWPDVHLQDVFFSLATTDGQGHARTFLVRNSRLSGGYYPADRLITIATPRLTEPGLYYAEVGATVKPQGAVTASAWFQHSLANSVR